MALNATFTASFDRFEASIKHAVVEVQTFDRAIKTSHRDLTRVVESFSGQKLAVESARMAEAVGQLGGKLGIAGGVAKLTDSELKRVSATLNEMAQKAGRMGEALPPSIAKLRTEIERTSVAAETFSSRMNKAGSELQGLGRVASAAITLPLTAGFLLATKAASDFESSFAGVRKTVNATEPEFQKLSDGFRKMSREIPVSVNELNKIGEAAGQLGIKTENILGFSRVMADLGVTTNLASDEAASALARLANITQMPQDQFDRLGSTVVGLGNNFATTEAEIVDFGLRIAGAGQIAGLSEHQILAIGAAMSSVGVQAEAGGTAVQKVLNKMTEAVATGNKSLAQFGEAAGMSADEFAAAFRGDAAGAFEAFVSGLGAQGDKAFQTLSNLGLSNERVIRSFLSLAGAGDVLSNALQQGAKDWEDNTALANEAEQRYKTFASQLAAFRNQVGDVAIEIGQTLLPTLRNLITLAQPLLQWAAEFSVRFAALPEPVRLTGLAIGAFMAALGPVLWVSGQFLTALGTVTAALGLKSLALRTAAVDTLALSAAQETAAVTSRGLWAALAGPLGIAAAIIGTGVAWATAKGDWTRFFDVVIPPLGFLRIGLDELNKTQREFAESAKATRDAALGITSALDPMIEKLLQASGMISPLLNDAKKAAKGGIWGSGADVGGGAASEFSQELEELRKGVAALTAEERKAIVEGKELGKSSEFIADRLSVSAAVVNKFVSSLKGAAKGTTRVVDESAKKIAAAGKAERQVMNEIGVAQMNYAREQMDRIRKVDDTAAKAHRDHMNRVGELRMAFDRSLIDAAAPKWLENMWVPLKEAAIPAGLEMGSTMGAGIKDGLMGVMGGAGGTLSSAFTGGGGVGGALKSIGVQMADAITKPMMERMKENSKAAAVAVGVGVSAATAIGGAVGGGTGASVAGLASGLGGAALAASKLGGSLATAGVVGSVAMAGMTAGIGLAAVGIFKLIQRNRNLNKEIKEWNKKIDETRVKLMEMYGPLDALDKKAKALGMSSFTNEWLHQGEKGAAQFAAFIKDFEARLKKTNDSFAPLLSSATELGVRLPASILASIEQLRELGILSEENASLLDQLAGAAEVDWKKMEEAAERYGIDLDSLGQQFQQLKFGDAAKQIINDFDLLSRGGADVGGILFGMQDEISKLVQDAKKFGVEIPKNMQPWIEELLRAGLLTDESGELLQDLAGIRFGEPIKTEFERITEALEKLIETLNLFASTLGNLPTPNVSFPSNPNPHGGEFGGTSPRSQESFSPGEPVLSRGSAHDFLSGVRDGSGAQTINVPISLDGRVIADVVIERAGNRLAVRGAR